VCLSVTILVGTEGTRQAKLRYQQKMLNIMNNFAKTEVRGL